MVQDHVAQARQQFEVVMKLQPKDALAAQFAKALSSSTQAATTPATDAAKTTEVPVASPPPAALVGTWKANPMADLIIELTLREDGQFTWAVNAKGRTESVTGNAQYLDGVLTLTQSDGPDLTGKIVDLGDKQFGFDLQSGVQAATIQFSR
jgi:hypothetical protein